MPTPELASHVTMWLTSALQINAEASGGGFPGWIQRNPALPRTRDPEWLKATENYASSIAKIIAKYQITEGGPVILLQPENEYSQADEEADPEFPDPVYWLAVENQFRDNGIVVPLISNDAAPHGYFAPGPPALYNVSVDIYGHDGYPLGFDCKQSQREKCVSTSPQATQMCFLRMS